MKFSACYSATKFKAFTYEEQIKALHKLILCLEQNLSNPEKRLSIIDHLLKLSQLVDEPLPQKMHFFLKELNPRLSPHQLMNKLYFYLEGSLRKDGSMSRRIGDGKISADPFLRKKAKQITVICDNLRSVFNVGSLFRTSECLGIGKILLCGITPTPEHSNMPKTAMGTEKLVEWQYLQTSIDAITICRESGMYIYALETVEEAGSIFQTIYKLPLAIVIGNEALGIEPSVLELCDECIALPQLGWKNSLNVGVATGIALYQIIFGGPNG